MKYIGTTQLTQDCRFVRETVFCDEQGFKEEFDTIDKDCYFVNAYLNNKIVGTGRAFIEDGCNGMWHIGRIAVLKEHRKKGIGAGIMQALEEYIASVGGKGAYLSSQIQVKDFYIAVGYQPEGEVYLEENYPHIKMIKELK